MVSYMKIIYKIMVLALALVCMISYGTGLRYYAALDDRSDGGGEDQPTSTGQPTITDFGVVA
jgi:hypothetical protein